MKNETAIGVVLISGLLSISAAFARDLQYNTYQPSTHGAVQVTERLGGVLKEKSKGSLGLVVQSGGSVASGKATLSVISDGLIDAGLVTDVYVPGDLPNTVIGSNLALEGTNAFVMSAAMTEYALLNCPGCKSDLEKRNVINLGHHSTGSYKLLCKPKIATLNDLSGKKIKAAGPWTRLVTSWKASSVNIPFNDVYEGLERGQLDCAVAPDSALTDYGLYDVVSTVVDYPIGTYHGYHSFVINRDVWKSLPEADRALLIAEMPMFIAKLAAVYEKANADARAAAEAKGIKYREAGEDLRLSIAAARTEGRATALSDARKRGIQNPEESVTVFTGLVKKWNDKLGDGPVDVDAFAAMLKSEIYDKTKF
ncbi:MAG: hypothetical protein B7Y95_02135 [Rhizobiales bacterium 32-66-11]|nr:MAG: hypothetical protein B7Y95_02135 [Rhizobiales bacterium 32-66-11]